MLHIFVFKVTRICVSGEHQQYLPAVVVVVDRRCGDSWVVVLVATTILELVDRAGAVARLNASLTEPNDDSEVTGIADSELKYSVHTK